MIIINRINYGKIFLMIKILINFIRDFKNYFFPTEDPFGKKILASKDYYLNIFEEAKKEIFPEVDNFEKFCKFKIEKLWLDNLALHTQVVKKKSKINYQHGRILYSALRKYISQNKIKNINILEIGTARGFSAICMSKAINDSEIEGIVNTIDIISNDKSIYWNCIDDHESKKTRKKLLKNWDKELNNINFLTGPSSFILKKINKDRIHFAYIDGMHDYFNTKKEFNFISKRQLVGDQIIFDDYSYKFPDIIRLVKEISEKKVYESKIISSSQDRSYVIINKLK